MHMRDQTESTTTR